MRNCDYGVVIPSEKKLKTSINLRPKSQPHRFSTSELKNAPSAVCSPPEDQGRKSFQQPIITQQPIS